jgi:hypothetical protein
MITHTTVQAPGQARPTDLYGQARHDALVRAARRARRARRQRSRAVRPGVRVPRRMTSVSTAGRVIRGG